MLRFCEFVVLSFECFFIILGCIIELFGVVFHFRECSDIFSYGHEEILLFIVFLIEVCFEIFFHEIHLIIIVLIIILLFWEWVWSWLIWVFLVMFWFGDDWGFEEWRMISWHHLYHGVDFSFWHFFMVDYQLVIIGLLFCGFSEFVVMCWFCIGV